MSAPHLLKPAQTPLQGLQLIEASAGTGKTWTIAALYLRLVLEAALPVESILVVTYTRAATAELRERIRARLLAAQRACESGDINANDEVLVAALHKLETKRALALLTLALESFDLAAIHTIHGFCQRALAERAFESGLDFASQMATDDSAVLREAVEDFWRREMAGASVFWARWLLQAMPGPAALLYALRAQFGKPYLHHIAPPPWTADAEQNFIACAEGMRRMWQSEADAAFALLQAHGGLSKVSHKPKRIETEWTRLTGWLAAPEITLPMPEGLALFTTTRLSKATTKKFSPPEHRLFNALEELQEAALSLELNLQARLGDLQLRALVDCETAVRAAKQRLSRRSFDDLLLDLHAALAGDGAEAMVAALRRRYAAALIDEFQDTDPLQYDIFSRVFVHDVAPLFFVGDPKQAIYSFRGADLHAYLAARTAAGVPWVLGTNRRSQPALVAAVNSLFSQQAQPFMAEALSFTPVDASPEPPPPLLIEGESPAAALEFWCLPRNAEGKVHNKGSANESIAAAVADEIARLLNLASLGEAKIGDKPLSGGDIAILVKSHSQGARMRNALLARGIASVRYGQDSVYDTLEAVEVERVLLAVAEPGREGLVRAALATDLCGLRGSDLAALDADAEHWMQHLQAFHDYHVLARDHGFVRMWRALLANEGVAERLLAFPDGERRMTNLQHLSDLLQTLAHDEGMSVEALAKRIADERAGNVDESDSEANLLRLESDEQLVKIVTIHTSKGLEYPITFCPFLWDGAVPRKRPGPLRFHDPAQENQAALDFGSIDIEAHSALAAQELREETLRLAYVALTRAKHRCVLVWGAIRDAASSPLAWLLYGANPPDFNKQSDADPQAPLLKLAASCPSIGVRPLPQMEAMRHLEAQEHTGELKAQVFPKRNLAPWRMHSFSAWSASTLHEQTSVAAGELPDHDAPTISSQTEESSEPPEVSNFPRGANAGVCLHGLFERADFANGRVDVAAVLQAHGFAEQWQPVATTLLQDVLDTPLDGATLTLRNVPYRAQLRELEFCLPLAAPNMQALAAAVGAGAGADGRLHERLLALAPPVLGGFLKGFIDLVFMHEGRYYVLDYKSNWLGARYSDYAPPALAAEMAQADYDLQALLYTLALHRLLKLREPDYDYERHCGGAYYLFLRGMHAEQGDNGVYYWRPEKELIERLDACLTRSERLFSC